MQNKLTKSILNKKKKIKIIIITFIFFINLLFNSNLFNQSQQFNNSINERSENLEYYNQDLEFANGGSTLFEGIESPLNITDYGNLYQINQHISLSNQEKLNLTYYLDDVHDWKASKIESSIQNIQDKRNWINNSGFKSPTIYRVYGSWGSEHNYSQGRSINWNNPIPDTEIIVSGVNAEYVRVHFTIVEFELDYDFFFICNGSNDIYYVNTSGDTDFYSPWIHGDTIRLLYSSDGSIEYYGYDIDYYEYVNSTSNFHINLDTWQFNCQEVTNGFNDYGTAQVDNSTAMYVALYGEYVDYNEFSYDTGAYSEIYQDFTIPSGPAVEAYLSFDYYCQYALPTNDHYLYVKFNDQKIFSKGMLDISELGKRKWLSSGKLYTDAWDNLTSIFKDNIYQQQFNISLGFMVGAGYSYSSIYSLEEGLTNIIYFDNISLVVTTKANSTQSGIDLRINGKSLEDREIWGTSNKTLTNLWESNPIILTLNSSSSFLTFDMNTTIYGYREGTTKINQQGMEGVSYQILSNGTIYWEFLHNLYVPSEYSDNNFIIEKPREWDFINIKDSTLQEVPFEKGKLGDSYLKINKTYAIFPGWWHFKATSPNYLNSTNTKLFKKDQWYENADFSTGESTQISTQIDYNGMIPKDTDEINLTIYHPNGTIFFTESKFPNDGNVTFSQITFSSFNTIGGLYEYTLFWSNGTALGGLKSSFIVVHDSYLAILKPDDAKSDNTTGVTVGDIIPLRVYLRDAENDQYISNALVSYNWTSGTKYFVEAALGIYETILDTSDLGGYGVYNIVINSIKIGFINSNLTLEINLGENTNLQRLESDSKIVINENSTIKFLYYSEFDDEGIPGAQVSVNINNPNYYIIRDLSDGIYSIEFSTDFINRTGVYRLIFEFTAGGYEP